MNLTPSQYYYPQQWLSHSNDAISQDKQQQIFMNPHSMGKMALIFISLFVIFFLSLWLLNFNVPPVLAVLYLAMFISPFLRRTWKEIVLTPEMISIKFNRLFRFSDKNVPWRDIAGLLLVRQITGRYEIYFIWPDFRLQTPRIPPKNTIRAIVRYLSSVRISSPYLYIRTNFSLSDLDK